MTRTLAAVALLALAPATGGGQTPQAASPERAGAEAEARRAAPAKASPSATPSSRASVVAPAARGLAEALTTREAWEGILDGFASGLAGQISGALAATGKDVPTNLDEEVRRDLDDAVTYDQAVEMQARALAGRFSEDELRELERFYRSGPGRKLLDALPEIARQVNDELRGRLAERVPGIVERHAPSIAAAPDAPGAGGDRRQGPASDRGAPRDSGRGSMGSGEEGSPPEREEPPAHTPGSR